MAARPRRSRPTCSGRSRECHRAARCNGARDGDPIDWNIEATRTGAPRATVGQRFADRRDRRSDGQRLMTRGAQRPALPAGTTNHNRYRDPLTRGHLLREESDDRATRNRHGATVSSPCLDADERTGERLQLYTSECGPIRDQPHIREHPDQHGPAIATTATPMPNQRIRRTGLPMRPHFSPRSGWHQFGHDNS